MITGGVLFISIRCVPHVTNCNGMLSCFIDMAIKRPRRSVTSGAEYEPDHEQLLEHTGNLPEINSVFENFGSRHRFLETHY